MIRYPFGVFEWYKGLPKAHPWQMNWFLGLTSATAVLTLGKGAENLTCRGGSAKPTRWIVPYWMRDYRSDYRHI